MSVAPRMDFQNKVHSYNLLTRGWFRVLQIMILCVLRLNPCRVFFWHLPHLAPQTLKTGQDAMTTPIQESEVPAGLMPLIPAEGKRRRLQRIIQACVLTHSPQPPPTPLLAMALLMCR